LELKIYYTTYLLFHVSNALGRCYYTTKEENYYRNKGNIAYNHIWKVQRLESEMDASQIKAATASTLMPVIASNAKHISGSRMHGDK